MDDGTRSTKGLGNTTEGIARGELRSEKVRALTRAEPRTVAPGTSLGEALREMQDGRGETLLVCEDRRLLGIVTERDVLTRVLAQDVDLACPIDDFMTPDPETLRGDATVVEAMRMMERGGYRNLPIVDDEGRLEALLRQQDLIEYVAEAFPQGILNLPPRPHQLMEQPEGG